MSCTHRACAVLSICLAFCLGFANAIPSQADPTDTNGIDSGDSWPQYRGPNRDGSSSPSAAFRQDGFGLEIAWKKPLGLGYSGVAIADGRAITLFTDGDKDVVAAFALDSGEEVWRHVIADAFPSKGGSDGGPNSVPAIADGIVYGFGPHGDLFAVRFDTGTPLWQRRFEESEGTVPYFGFTTSPLVTGELLIVETGGGGNKKEGETEGSNPKANQGHAITAIDRATGETVWTHGVDKVTYQSPQISQLAGRPQLLASTEERILALDPDSGTELWSFEHGFESTGISTSIPLPLGEGGLLVNGPREALVLDVAATDAGFQVTERWRSNALKRSMGLPVVHEGYVFGMSGPFLTCLDLKDGSLAWRSRPPGGTGFSLIDGHLVGVGQTGDLVVSKANPTGYDERARIPLFKDRGWTAPSFAEDRILVRNVEELVAIRITDGSGTTARAERPRTDGGGYLGNFGVFLRDLESLPVEKRTAEVDAFVAANSSWPITEAEGEIGYAHILFRGEATDVAIQGNITGQKRDLVMRQIEGTDFFYHSFELDPRGIWEYRLAIEFQDPVADPANPRQLTFGNRVVSPLAMPRFEAFDPAAIEIDEDARGQVLTMPFSSKVLANDRDITLYLPAGYGSDDDRTYPLLLVNSGQEHPFLHFENTLDQLIAEGDMQPVVAVFVPQNSFQEHSRANSAKTVSMLLDELLPQLQADYCLHEAPAERGIYGVGTGGFMATLVALSSEGAFGKVGTQSYTARDGQGKDVLELISARQNPDLSFYIEQRNYDARISGGNPRKASAALVEGLRGADMKVQTLEVPGGAGVSSWRASLGELLKAMYPPGS